MPTFDSKVIAAVERLIRQDIKDSELQNVSLTKHEKTMAALEKQIQTQVEDFADELEPTKDKNELKEQLDNVFDMYVGDALRDDIAEHCKLDPDDDEEGPVVDRIWHEMKLVFLKRLAG